MPKLTPAELTALLAPVREKLDEIERFNDGLIAADVSMMNADSQRATMARGRLEVVEAVRRELDRLNPEPDALVVLGMAALGMLRELREECPELAPSHDWADKADALLAAAYPKG